MIVDAQLHPFAANTDEMPWASSTPYGVHLPEVTGTQLVAAMDEVGVDRGIIVSPIFVYRFDTRYAESVYQEHPERFRLVTPVDPLRAGVADRIEQWAATPGAVGIRLMFGTFSDLSAGHPGVEEAIRAAIAHDLAINVQCWERLEVVDDLASKFPEAKLVLDHLGMTQRNEPPAPTDPFREIDRVLALARHGNLTVKITGAGTVSHEPFPYEDLWAPVGRVIDAFGVRRCMWGSDWTRATPFLSYEQSVSAFRDHWPMSDSEKAALLGENALRIYSWDRS